MSLINHAQQMISSLEGLEFPSPVAMTYNPLTYAWGNHKQYLERFGTGRKRALFLGMNPGPWGMAQTGVPFGEIPAVRDWMKLDGEIRKPEKEHPKRPIDGFACERSEVSGRRLWGYFSKLFPEAPDFFKEHFIVNFCPLVWMSETGANITPDKLSKKDMMPVETACMEHLMKVVEELEPEFLIGVGAFAEKRLKAVKDELGSHDLKVGKILHPSPASPAANRGWEEAAEKQLIELGIINTN